MTKNSSAPKLPRDGTPLVVGRVVPAAGAGAFLGARGAAPTLADMPRDAAIAAVTVSSKGRIVIPKKIRDRHGWKAGAELVVVDTPQGVLIRTARA